MGVILRPVVKLFLLPSGTTGIGLTKFDPVAHGRSQSKGNNKEEKNYTWDVRPVYEILGSVQILHKMQELITGLAPYTASKTSSG